MMRQILAMSLLIAGVALAGAFGSMNPRDLVGHREARYRPALLEAIADDARATLEAEMRDNSWLGDEQSLRSNADWSDVWRTAVYATSDECWGGIEELADATLASHRLRADDGPEAACVDDVALGMPVDTALSAAQATLLQNPLPEPEERMTGWLSAGGLPWGAGILLIVVGAVLARRRAAAAAVSGAGDVDFLATVRHLREQVVKLQAALEGHDGDVPDVRAVLDDLEIAHVQPVVDQRARFVAKHGLGAFAEYFGAFSAAERNLHRAWSALTDEHAPAARLALDSAATQLEEAEAAWTRAGG